jgi:hypothetical protein
MPTNHPQDDFVKTALRLPKDLHTAVHASAKTHDRSFNGQIVAVLRAALLTPATTQQGATQ